jgi:hypothetical protein
VWTFFSGTKVPPSLKIPMTERDNSRVRKMLEREVLRERGRWGQRGSEGALFVLELVLACFPASGLAARE